MQQVRVLVEHVEWIPGDLPAVWEEETTQCGVDIRLYLLDGMSQEMGDHFRSMAVREAFPGASFDSFTVTTEAVPVAAVSA